jgi:hypothetical protein
MANGGLVTMRPSPLILVMPLAILLIFVAIPVFAKIDQVLVNPYWPLSVQNAKVRIVAEMVVFVWGVLFLVDKIESYKGRNGGDDRASDKD